VNFTATEIPGCLVATLDRRVDARGAFCKTYQEDWFTAAGLPLVYREQYYSVSRKGVIRGMHFQLPPCDHGKVVYCTSGAIHDVVMDLRVGSPTYGRCAAFELNGASPSLVFVPRGCAHGFAVRSEEATTCYMVETTYDNSCDAGVRWDSIGHGWPGVEPVLSDRDRALPRLRDFVSPFRYGALA